MALHSMTKKVINSYHVHHVRRWETRYLLVGPGRFVLGLANGIVPALRTTLRELCGPEHMVRAMSYFSGKGVASYYCTLHLHCTIKHRAAGIQ